MSKETLRPYQTYKNWKCKSKQTEYTEETPLIASDGTLLAKGWARHNVFDYNRDFVKKGSPTSKKEWDFYQVADGNYMVQLSFANIGIGGYIAAKLIDLKAGKVIADATQLFIGGGKYIPPKKGDVPNRFAHKIGKAEFDFDTREDSRTLYFKMPLKGKIVECKFDMDIMPGLENITTVLPFEGDKTKYGNDWNARGVRRVLVNPIYCGVLVNHKYEIEDFLTGKQVNIPKEEHFYHERPSWAIVPPEVFQKAQEIMESRRIKYDSGEPFREARYSSKHIFSTLIKCEHCGRSFTRKSYTYVNTRNYWRCVTNDQYTAEKCDNRVCLEEPELLEQLREYFSSLIADKDAFIASILASLDKQMPASQNPELIKKDIEAKRKKLLSKKDRYQEMYANDIMTIDELKDKVTAITEELKELDMDLEQLALSKKIVSNAEDIIRRYTEEIHRFLELETVTNVDMRRILDHISVDRDGHVRVVLKKFEDII